MNEIIGEFLKLKKWANLYPVQAEAVNRGILDRRVNFIVVAPTGSGKTGIAEIAILQELQNKCKVIYAVPSHALITDKLEDFSYLAREFKVERGETRHSRWTKADLIVTTFELLYRACLRSKQILDFFGLIVVDEFHLLYDKYRGYNLEKVLTILQQLAKEKNLRIVCISATIEDKDELKEWLGARVIHSDVRPADLIHDVIDLRKDGSNKKLCQEIVSRDLKPCLIFCATKNRSKNRAVEMCGILTGNKDKKDEIVDKVKNLISKEELPELEKLLCSCLSKGVGFHHSDLRGELRGFVADLFKKRQIDYLFCTTGLAYGINFPAKAVVVADLYLWDYDEHKNKPIQIHLYRQMAGRAGRPQYDKEGISFVVIRKDDDYLKFNSYVEAPLPRVTSQIRYDEYFRKAILELIYSERNTDEEITGFFENSLFHFQATRKKNTLTPYVLDGLLKGRVKYLQNAGFIERLGVDYKLTDFGRVTLDYLFNGYSSPELAAFIRLNQYLEKAQSLQADFSLVCFLLKTFPSCRISRQLYKKAEEVDDYLLSKEVDDSGVGYSAYAVWLKWMWNVDEADIDNSCQVYSSRLPLKMWGLYRLLDVYEKLAVSKTYEVPQEFQVIKERIRYGVREEELPFVKIRGIGREIVRELHTFCNNLRTNLGYSGTMVDTLKSFLEKEGEDKFLSILEDRVGNVGKIRARKILSLIQGK